MHFLFFCDLSQPVMCLICYLKSHSLNHGDTCWVGGNPHVHPEPYTASCCLGHVHSAGTAPRSVLWVEGGNIHWAWVWERELKTHPRKTRRQQEVPLKPQYMLPCFIGLCL